MGEFLQLSPGMKLFKAWFDGVGQAALLANLRHAVVEAPLFTPEMPKTGKPFSVRMTNLGNLGWVSDRVGGYRYQANHPATGKPWPPMPDALLGLWAEVADYAHPPEACLVNFYNVDAKMGLHQDRDEQDFAAPVVSVSLGDTALFRWGGTARGDKTQSVKLESGDVLVMGGESRLCFHGVDRVYAGTSTIVERWRADQFDHAAGDKACLKKTIQNLEFHRDPYPRRRQYHHHRRPRPRAIRKLQAPRHCRPRRARHGEGGFHCGWFVACSF